MSNQETLVGRTDHSIVQSREDEADAALRHTSLTPGMGWFLCVMFLLTIVSVPIIQAGVEIHRNLEARQQASGPATSGASSSPNGRILPQVFDVFSLLPTAAKVQSARSFSQWWALLPSVKSIREYENALEAKSLLTEWLLPRTQAVLTGYFGLGNEQAFCGLQHWLFYRPDVEYLTGPPFLDPATLRARAKSGDEATTRVQPDPIKAIVQFKDQLAARGIELIVMPAPVKPVIHPEMLSDRFYPSATATQNPSYRPFLDALSKAGVQVFDVGDLLARTARETNTPQYLQTDTHWTPAAMDLAAQELARSIVQSNKLAPMDPVAYTRRPNEISNLGDIAVMLKLPEDQQLYPKQQVTTQQVYSPDGTPWTPSRQSDILLLGDSFSNIYSLGGMDWGEGAGFGEQLSYYLQRPLDRIVVNAGGAYSSRQRLVEEMAHGRDRLAGKKLVIYEFAMRDLSSGDWKLLDLPPPTAGTVAPQPIPTLPTPPPPAEVKPPIAPTIAPPANAVPLSPNKVPGQSPAPAPLITEVPRTAPVPPRLVREPATFTGNPQTNNSTRPNQGFVPAPPNPIPAPAPHPRQPVVQPTPAPANAPLIVQGTVKSIATPPKPGTVPYKDCIVGLRLVGVRVLGGGKAPADLLVYVWGMRDNQPVEAASYTPGQTLKLALRPWDSVENTYGGYNRRELDDPDALSLDAYWGEATR